MAASHKNNLIVLMVQQAQQMFQDVDLNKVC